MFRGYLIILGNLVYYQSFVDIAKREVGLSLRSVSGLFSEAVMNIREQVGENRRTVSGLITFSYFWRYLVITRKLQLLKTA